MPPPQLQSHFALNYGTSGFERLLSQAHGYASVRELPALYFCELELFCQIMLPAHGTRLACASGAEWPALPFRYLTVCHRFHGAQLSWQLFRTSNRCAR